MSAFMLASCGGGGAAATPELGGNTHVEPDGATFYGGVPATMTVNGSAPPYLMTSSEPSIFPVPSTLNGHSFTVVPVNPSVVDAGLKPEELQVKTVIITARSAEGLIASARIKVGQNFLTGYGFFFTSSTCLGGGPCAGGESLLHFDTTFNGQIQPNRAFRITRIRGPFQFVDPLNTNNQTDEITITSDIQGKATAIIRVAAGIPSQVALLKITDVATGAFVLDAFTISGTPATALITPIPDTITLTGPSDKLCGYGTADILLFDGQTPYTLLTCTNPNIFVGNTTSSTQPGRFTISVGASNICMTDEQCVFQDNTGARTSVKISTVIGAAPPPLPAFDVQPTTLTLACGNSGSVTAVGGSGSYSVNSTHPRVTAVVSGNTITITRAAGPDPAPPYLGSATVTVTDGATIKPVTVTVPTTC